MRWSITKRIGRGLSPMITTASKKLTWLQASTAAPSAGMRSVSTARRRYSVCVSTQARKRSRNSGTSR